MTVIKYGFDPWAANGLSMWSLHVQRHAQIDKLETLIVVKGCKSDCLSVSKC